MKLSVIVCNQRGRYLHWALKGIRWQTLSDFETIVVDYGMDPPFGTIAAPVTEGPRHLRVLRWEDTEWNHPRARNIGIANARGERIVIVNSDCLMAPTLLEEAGWLLDQNPHRQIYWQRWDLSEEGLRALRSFDRPQELFGDGDNWHGRGWGDFHSLSTYGDFLMVERDVVMEYGGFDERATGWGVYDHDLACRLDRHGYPSFWAEGLRLAHLWHPQRPGLDESWRRNIDAMSPDFQAGRDVRNQGRATFERYRVEGIVRLELEITHRCNKNCRLCDHRIATSDYDYLTMEQYWQILDAARPRLEPEHPGEVVEARKPSAFDRVLLIGGEPLMHPHFVKLVWRVMTDFGQHIVQVATNGKLLPQVKQGDLMRLEWIVQEYPGWNDEVVAKFRHEPNVTIRPHREFWDPYDDPDLDEEMARRVADHCQRQVRVVGTRLYRCCLSEGVERYYQTGPVHVEFSENWRQDWEALPVWKACAHCFRAREALAAMGEGA